MVVGLGVTDLISCVVLIMVFRIMGLLCAGACITVYLSFSALGGGP